jgi:hypothetical protein
MIQKQIQPNKSASLVAASELVVKYPLIMKKTLYLLFLILATSCGEDRNSTTTPKDDSLIVKPNIKKASNIKPTKDLLGIANAFNYNSELKHLKPAKNLINIFEYDKDFCLHIWVGSVLDGFNILEINGDKTATLYTKPPNCKSIKINLNNDDIVGMIELLNSKKIGQMSDSYNSDINDGTHISVWFKNKEAKKSIDLDNFFPEEIKSLVNWANETLDSKKAIVTKISQKEYFEIRNQSKIKP